MDKRVPFPNIERYSPPLIEEMSDDEETDPPRHLDRKPLDYKNLVSRLDFDDDDIRIIRDFNPHPSSLNLRRYKDMQIKREVPFRMENSPNNIEQIPNFEARPSGVSFPSMIPQIPLAPNNVSNNPLMNLLNGANQGQPIVNNADSPAPRAQFLPASGFPGIPNFPVGTAPPANAEYPQNNGFSGMPNSLSAAQLAELINFQQMQLQGGSLPQPLQHPSMHPFFHYPFGHQIPGMPQNQKPFDPTGITRARIEEMLDFLSRMGPSLEEHRNLIILLTAFKSPHNYSSEAKMRELLEYCVNYFYTNFAKSNPFLQIPRNFANFPPIKLDNNTPPKELKRGRKRKGD